MRIGDSVEGPSANAGPQSAQQKPTNEDVSFHIRDFARSAGLVPHMIPSGRRDANRLDRPARAVPYLGHSARGRRTEQNLRSVLVAEQRRADFDGIVRPHKQPGFYAFELDRMNARPGRGRCVLQRPFRFALYGDIIAFFDSVNLHDLLTSRPCEFASAFDSYEFALDSDFASVRICCSFRPCFWVKLPF